MSPIRPRLLLTVVAMLSLIPVAGMADIYKWVDEDGVTHYSQQPPPAGTATVITPAATPPADTTDGQGGDGEGQDGGADSGNSDGEQETIADFCKELRDRKTILQSDRPIRIKAEDGTLTDLDDEGRAQQLERVQNQLQDHCQDVDVEGGGNA